MSNEQKQIMETISEDKFWELFNYYIHCGYDERTAQEAVLMDYKVNWEYKD